MEESASLPDIDYEIEYLKGSLFPRSSNSSAARDHYRIAEILRELINGSAIEKHYCLDQREWYDLINIFFFKYPPYHATDTRFDKYRNNALKRYQVDIQRQSEALEALKIKQRGFPYKWITNNKAIVKNLNKPRNRHVLKVYKQLMDDRLRPALHGTPILVKPDYVTIEKTIGLKPKYTRRCLREMCRWKMIEKRGMDGERGQYLYSLGMWMQGRSKFPKPVYLLKNSPEMIEALIKFNAIRG